MPDLCSTHPTQSAWWQCPRCHKYLCPQCISHRRGGFMEKEHFYFCPKCNVAANRTDITNVIPPFWKRLHNFFVYPFSSAHSIGLILGLALIAVILGKISTVLPGLFSLLLFFLVWGVMIKYSYESLLLTSEGRFAPPPLKEETLSQNFGITIQQIVLFVILGAIFWFFIAGSHPLIFYLYRIGIPICIPAMLILLAVNRDVMQALNPVRILGMVYQIGWGYLLLAFLVATLSEAPGLLSAYVVSHLPKTIQTFIQMAVWNYYTLISYHLMGYVILQYHEKLNYPIELETLLESIHPDFLNREAQQATQAQNAVLSRDGRVLQAIEPYVQEGDLDKAIDLIQENTELEIEDLELSDRFVNLLKMQDYTVALGEYAPHHMNLLIKAEDKKKAVTHYVWCLQNQVALTLPPAELFKLAGWCGDLNQPKLAIQAFNRIIKEHPQSPLVPKAYFRGAQILNERLESPQKAKKILQGLIAKYPDHDISNFARNYLAGI